MIKLAQQSLETILISTMYFRFLFQASFILLWLLCSLNNNYAQQPEQSQYPRSHFVKVKSLLPSTVCNRNSTKVPKKVSLEVVSKYGPCSALNKGKEKTPSYSEILLKDRSRINFIKSRISESKNLKQTLGISVPAKTKTDGSFGDFYAIVSLGTQQQDVSLVLDTGSGITWTQCKPCTKHCFKQSHPLFDPARSKSTYSHVPCGSSTCKQLASVGQDAGCIANKCAYQSVYGDNTYTIGFWSTEKITLTNGSSSLVINGYNFGCGFNNSAAAGDAQALGGASGILGLDRSPFSFISQMPASFNKYFSYCLSSSASSPGYINFGKTAEDIKNKHLKFTPLTNVPQTPEFYGIVVTGISVDGKKLSVRDSAYTESSAIIDSGTTLTTLPKKVYSALKSAFRKQMLKHNKMKPISGTDDLCYDFSKVDVVINIPAISIFLKGGIELKLDVLGILYGSDVRNMCLGFSANDDKNDPLILGNVQQRGRDVHYDVANGKLGIAPGGCDS